MSRILKKRYNLPEPPFFVYLLQNNEVFPKRLFTVTRISFRSDRVRLFVFELKDFIDFDDTQIQVVQGFAVN